MGKIKFSFSVISLLKPALVLEDQLPFSGRIKNSMSHSKSIFFQIVEEMGFIQKKCVLEKKV